MGWIKCNKVRTGDKTAVNGTRSTILARRHFLHTAGAAVAVPLFGQIAWAQRYPARGVRMVVPFAPAGATDLIARIVAKKLSERMGGQFYVENHAGAGGNVGMGFAAKAPEDGYTILLVSSSFLINPVLYAKVPYDPIKDFAPVTIAATSPILLVVNPVIPASNVKELVAFVKANPGRYSYASPGAGNSLHLAGEMFRITQGLDLVHVPFDGGPASIASTIAGHTLIAIANVVTAASNVRDGTLRALAVMSSRRCSILPDVPTMEEAGLPRLEADNITGVLVRAGTPSDIIALLYREIVAILALPDVKERLATLGFEIVASTPEEFAARIPKEIARWDKVIRDANIKLQ